MTTVVQSKDPQYTVKDVAEKLGLTKHTIRYYDNEHLIPYSSRSENNIRLFSDFDLDWLRIINCLRLSGLPIPQVKQYVQMCLKGDETIPERAQIIFQQEKELERKEKEIQIQLEIIKKKKIHYQQLLANGEMDHWNPENKNMESISEAQEG